MFVSQSKAGIVYQEEILMATSIIKDEHGVTQWVECIHGCGEWWRAGESIFMHYQTKHADIGLTANVLSVGGVVMAHPDLTIKVINDDLAIIQRHCGCKSECLPTTQRVAREWHRSGYEVNDIL